MARERSSGLEEIAASMELPVTTKSDVFIEREKEKKCLRLEQFIQAGPYDKELRKIT